uniref:Metalloendopeptidase OMA1, mitochondrial n=1 Tax=Romanomermis culicivorax TaxID=13658 RepID=A0A915L1J4_ROMCU
MLRNFSAWPKEQCNVHGVLISMGLLSLYYYYHIDKCSLTGRRRFITITRHQFDTMCDLQSKLLLKQLQSFILRDNDFRVLFIKRVARRLLSANTDLEMIKNFNWSVYVIDAKLANVLVVPNGNIFVFTGMLDNFENEDQLGIVLGHEMAHAILGHGLEQASWSQLLDSIMLIFIAIIWAAVPAVAAALTHWFAYTVMEIVTQLPHTRKLEIEADDFGLKMASKACFDPREVYAFWTAAMMKSKVKQEISLPDFLSTHPNHGDRAARLDPIIDEALKVRESCDCPPLKRYDPRILADVKKEMIERQLAMKGNIL